MAALTSCGSCSEARPGMPGVWPGCRRPRSRDVWPTLGSSSAGARASSARASPTRCCCPPRSRHLRARSTPRWPTRSPKRRGRGCCGPPMRRSPAGSVLRPGTRRPWARSRLVLRPEDRPARARLRLRVRHRLSRRREGRHDQIRLGAIAPPPADRARRRLFPDLRRALRGIRGGAAAVLVASQPVPVGRALDERNRARRPAARLGLGPAPFGRLAGGRALFDDNPEFLRQLHHHQEYLARLSSHGSSANNHLIAEQAGQFAACCAFPYFARPRVGATRPPARSVARCGCRPSRAA